jgi:SNF2 family DNA or RNA helicase
MVKYSLSELNIPYVEVNGKLTPRQRKIAVNSYNNDKDPVRVLFVSSAGAEGLDLKKTQSVIILEPHWNNERIKQVIGRAVRYKSHDGLPQRQRHVDIYQLILKKPKNVPRKNSADKQLVSADDLLAEISRKKDEQIDQFYKILIASSI